MQGQTKYRNARLKKIKWFVFCFVFSFVHLNGRIPRTCDQPSCHGSWGKGDCMDSVCSLSNHVAAGLLLPPEISWELPSDSKGPHNTAPGMQPGATLLLGYCKGWEGFHSTGLRFVEFPSSAPCAEHGRHRQWGLLALITVAAQGLRFLLPRTPSGRRRDRARPRADSGHQEMRVVPTAGSAYDPGWLPLLNACSRVNTTVSEGAPDSCLEAGEEKKGGGRASDFPVFPKTLVTSSSHASFILPGTSASILAVLTAFLVQGPCEGRPVPGSATAPVGLLPGLCDRAVLGGRDRPRAAHCFPGPPTGFQS